MVERFLEIFMDDFSIYGDSFDQCLHNLELVLKQCTEKNFDFKLRNAPLRSTIWDCPRSRDFQERDRSGQSEDRSNVWKISDLS